MSRPLAACALLFIFGAVSLGAASREDAPGALPVHTAAADRLRCSSWGAETEEAPEPALTPLLEQAALDMWSGHGTTKARIHEIAVAVAAATSDELTGVWLVALAQSETDFQDRYVTGQCNGLTPLFGGMSDPSVSGMCDHGAAFGYWQQHLDEQHRPGDICGAQCLSSVSQCAASALRWLRETPTAWGSWAAQRGRAAEWLRRRNAKL